MPDIGTPQATWRDDPKVAWMLKYPNLLKDCEAAVVADRRIQAATLRAKIEALPKSPHYASHEDEVSRDDVLAVLDAVLGGDS